MTHAQAVQCASAFGGEVMPVGAAPSYNVMPKTDPAPTFGYPGPFGPYDGEH